MTSVRLILDLTLTPQTAASFLLFRATMPVYQTNLVPISDTVLCLSYGNRSSKTLNFAFTLTALTAVTPKLFHYTTPVYQTNLVPVSDTNPKLLRRNRPALTSNVFYGLLPRRMSCFPA